MNLMGLEEHFVTGGALDAWRAVEPSWHQHDRVVFAVEGGELRFRDMRELQGITLAERPDGIGEVLAGLGPDASRREAADRVLLPKAARRTRRPAAAA